MLERITKIAVLCASIGVIVITIEISTLTFSYYRNGFPPLLNPESKVQNQPTPRVGPYPGMKVSAQDINWAKSDRTLIFVLSTQCGLCTASADFYKEVVKAKQSVDGIQFVALFPQDMQQSEQYLKNLGIGIQDVKQSMPFSVGANGFPTLMLVDNTGIVKKAWVGKLTEEKEREVIKQIKCKNCS